MKDNICEKIKVNIGKYKMISAGDTIVIGTSGGADSMALLKFFIDSKNFYNIKIIAAHINHCLRGWESDRDENFVREFCDKSNIDLRVLKTDVSSLANESGMGIEECARHVRYSFFYELAKEPNSKIATAHTLSDNVETVILNLSRGAGPAGLSGIPAVRGKIIRPILCLKRIETETFCKENNISFVTDSTNLSRNYSRNRVRLDVIPVLKKLNPSLENSVSRLIFTQEQDNKYFEEQVASLLNELECGKDEYLLAKVNILPFSLKSRFVLRAANRFLDKNLEFIHVMLILEMMAKGSGSVNFSENAYAGVKGKKLIFYNGPEKVKSIEESILPIRSLQIGSKKIIFKLIDKKEYEEKLKIHKLLFINAIDYDTINNGTVIRNRRSGDKFCRYGRNVTKTIKKLFNEEKIPIEKRDKILMLANASNILWIEGQGVSSEAKVKESTKKVILIFEEETNNAQ